MDDFYISKTAGYIMTCGFFHGHISIRSYGKALEENDFPPAFFDAGDGPAKGGYWKAIE